MSSALLSLLVLGTTYASSFGENEGPLPWNIRYQYERTNVSVPADHTYFLTVIYSSHAANSERDKYLRYWFHNHPALIDLKSKVNFKEVSVQDPIYHSYLGRAVPNPPAVLVTLPADQGYFGRAAYCAYGQYLPTDPNQLVRELQATFTKYSQVYESVVPAATQHQIALNKAQRIYGQSVPQCTPDGQCFPRPQPYYPPQYQPQQYPQTYPQQIQPIPPIRPTNINNGISQEGWILLIGAAVVIFLVTQRRRR